MARDTTTDRVTAVEASCAVRHVTLDSVMDDHETRIRCLEKYHVKMAAYTAASAAIGSMAVPFVLKYFAGL